MSSKVQTAKRNIVVYKGFCTIYVWNKKDALISPYRSAKYYLGKTKEIKKFSIRKYSSNGEVNIDRGLHAHTSMKFAERRGWKTIAKCVIPRGTKFYRNTEKGEIVALKIKVVEIVKSL